MRFVPRTTPVISARGGSTSMRATLGVGPQGPQGEQGEVGPSGGPFPDLTGVTAGKVAQTTGDGGVEFIDLSASIEDVGADLFAAKLGGVIKSAALADGTDQSTVLQAEADALEALGSGIIELRAGTIVGAVALASDVGLSGAGVGATILKAPASHVGGVVKSKGYDTLTGTAALTPETRGAHRVEIRNLTIDGNKANAASSVGIQIYGAGWRLQGLRVQNCGSDGIQTEFGSDVNFTTLNSLEGYADNIMTCGNGGHGWRFRGPHDSNINNLVSHSNAGWGFRNESSSGYYNGTLGHCSRFNMFLNANGWYVGAAIASYTGGQSAGSSGTGLEIAAGVGSCILHGLLVAGWTTGAILRGASHDISLTVQRNATGVQVDALGGSMVRLNGEQNDTAIVLTSESTPNQFYGLFSVSTSKTLVSGTFNSATYVMLTQYGGAGSATVFQNPTVFTLPASNEVRSSRRIASESNLYAGRNLAGQITIGPTVAFGGVPGLVIQDATIMRDGANRIAVPADHTIRTGRNVTGSRPSASTVGAGAMFYDTTLGKPIWSDGTNWKDASGTTV